MMYSINFSHYADILECDDVQGVNTIPVIHVTDDDIHDLQPLKTQTGKESHNLRGDRRCTTPVFLPQSWTIFTFTSSCQ